MGNKQIHNEEFTKRLNYALDALRNDDMAFATWTLNAIDVFELFAKNNGKTVEEVLQDVITMHKAMKQQQNQRRQSP